MSASSVHRRLLHYIVRARVPLFKISFMANRRQLCLQWAREHRALQADWHHVFFPEKSRFSLWDHDGRVRVRRYADQCCFLDYITERNSVWTLVVMVWSTISYQGRASLLRIKGNLNSNRHVPQPEVVPFLQRILGAIFKQDNARLDVAMTFRVFCLARHMELLPWLAYSPDMSAFDH